MFGYTVLLQGLYEKGQPLYERAIEIWESALGTNHPCTGLEMKALAELLLEKMSAPSWEAIQRSAIAAVRCRTKGSKHVCTAQARQILCPVELQVQ